MNLPCNCICETQVFIIQISREGMKPEVFVIQRTIFSDSSFIQQKFLIVLSIQNTITEIQICDFEDIVYTIWYIGRQTQERYVSNVAMLLCDIAHDSSMPSY